MPGHLWRPNGAPDYRIGDGEGMMSYLCKKEMDK